MCHQKIIQLEAARTPEPDEDLKRIAASSLSNARVVEIEYKTAEPLILKFEYLQNMGAARHCFGLYFDNYLAGVVVFGMTGGTHVPQSICGKEHADKVRTLIRGCCTHWSPANSPSYLINRACALMAAKGFPLTIAYADESAFELGCCYQAAGWDYIGLGGRDTAQRRPDGRLIGSRCISAYLRDRKGQPDPRRGATLADAEAWIAQSIKEGYTVVGQGFNAWRVRKNWDGSDVTRAQVKWELESRYGKFQPTPRKHRYLHIGGDKRTQRLLRKALRYPILPYPKRGLDEGVALSTPQGSQVQSLESAPILSL
jgi:hypothetical protein